MTGAKRDPWCHDHAMIGYESVQGSNSFYTVLVRGEQGWRQLVAPAVTPEEACRALADLILSSKPLNEQSDADRQYADQALGLSAADGYEVTIAGHRHRLASASLLVSFTPDGPRTPDPDDRMFMEMPWDLADDLNAEPAPR
jgi:hypothetical protein